MCKKTKREDSHCLSLLLWPCDRVLSACIPPRRGLLCLLSYYRIIVGKFTIPLGAYKGSFWCPAHLRAGPRGAPFHISTVRWCYLCAVPNLQTPSLFPAWIKLGFQCACARVHVLACVGEGRGCVQSPQSDHISLQGVNFGVHGHTYLPWDVRAWRWRWSRPALFICAEAPMTPVFFLTILNQKLRIIKKL